MRYSTLDPGSSPGPEWPATTVWLLKDLYAASETETAPAEEGECLQKFHH
jgi:hypothetical protein